MSTLFACKNDEKFSYTEEQINSLGLNATDKTDTNRDFITPINLDPLLKSKAFDFGSLVKEIKVIPLETNNKSLLDNVRDIIVSESNIYVYDDFKGGGIVIFDRKGKFIKRISNGRGPGEISGIYNVSYDEIKKEILVYQHPYILFYDSKGEFLKQKRVPLGFHDFTNIENGYILKTFDSQGNEHLKSFKNYNLLITDKDFKVKNVGLPISDIGINLSFPNCLSKQKDKVSITHRFVDTIYSYNSKKGVLMAQYALNYKKKIPNNFLEYPWKKFVDAATSNDYYFFLGEYLESYTHQFFIMNSYHVGKQNIIYRNKKTGELRGGTTANFDSGEIPFIAFPTSTYEDSFVSLHYINKKDNFQTNSSIISNEDKLKLKNITENDNPLLVFFKLKNF